MTSPVRAALSLAALLSLAGCGTSPLKAIGSITGTGKSVSDTERVFLIAAGSWDRNHDNVVTCEEWKAYATELFNGADANRDEFIDATEWGKIVAIDRMFETADLRYFDANGDGKVSRAEFVDKQNPAFRLMDTANTCTLNGDQIAGARSKTEYDTGGTKKEDPFEKNAGKIGK